MESEPSSGRQEVDREINRICSMSWWCTLQRKTKQRCRWVLQGRGVVANEMGREGSSEAVIWIKTWGEEGAMRTGRLGEEGMAKAGGLSRRPMWLEQWVGSVVWDQVRLVMGGADQIGAYQIQVLARAYSRKGLPEEQWDVVKRQNVQTHLQILCLTSSINKALLHSLIKKLSEQRIWMDISKKIDKWPIQIAFPELLMMLSMRRCSTQLTLQREMQIKSTRRYHFTPTR